MTRHTLTPIAQIPQKSSSTGEQSNSRPRPSNSLPGGNWPSKVPGRKSGGNRGQGPKA